MKVQDIIVQLLASLGSQKEAQHYLKRYASTKAPAIAVIKVGGQVIDDDIDALADALAFLQQLHLRPVVVHGAGPQLSRALKAAAVDVQFANGMRVTTPEVLLHARRVFREVGQKLVDALAERQVPARPIPTSVVDVQPHANAALGLVGEVTAVHTESLLASVRAEAIAVVEPLGETAGGQLLNVNADVVTAAIAAKMQAQKVVFLSAVGGLLNEKGHIISALNLREDYHALMEKPWLTDGMRLKVQQIQSLLLTLPSNGSVSITSPNHLARELFTHQGAGTLLRLGERIQKFIGFDEVDIGQMRTLMESCFGKRLSANYFSEKSPLAVYVAGSMRAVAIVTTEGGVPYLDKFAVTKEAQGEGVGASLWAALRRDHPTLVWRSRRENPINPWYFKQADGCVRKKEWVVFWIGMPDLQQTPALVRHVATLPATLSHAILEAV